LSPVEKDKADAASSSKPVLAAELVLQLAKNSSALCCL